MTSALIYAQAVAFKDEKVMAAFFSPDQLKIDRDKLKVKKSCLVMISNNKVYVSDPTNKGGPVNIRWKGNRDRSVE